MEQSNYRHFHTWIPIKIQTQVSDTKQYSQITQGILEIISYGGAYFTCDNISSFLRKDQIRECIITSLLKNPDSRPLFTGKIRVVRVDPPQLDCNGNNGVAIEFISGKLFGWNMESTSPVVLEFSQRP
jgi:hypothetical protein